MSRFIFYIMYSFKSDCSESYFYRLSLAQAFGKKQSNPHLTLGGLGIPACTIQFVHSHPKPEPITKLYLHNLKFTLLTPSAVALLLLGLWIRSLQGGPCSWNPPTSAFPTSAINIAPPLLPHQPTILEPKSLCLFIDTESNFHFMFFNLMSVSSMILIDLSNQHVLGRLITGSFSLSRHNRAHGSNSPGENQLL